MEERQVIYRITIEAFHSKNPPEVPTPEEEGDVAMQMVLNDAFTKNPVLNTVIMGRIADAIVAASNPKNAVPKATGPKLVVPGGG